MIRESLSIDPIQYSLHSDLLDGPSLIKDFSRSSNHVGVPINVGESIFKYLQAAGGRTNQLMPVPLPMTTM